jgi:hypothetical protein
VVIKRLVCGCATGVFSSRKMKRRLHKNLAFAMPGADNCPQRRTMREFRALHWMVRPELSVQRVKRARPATRQRAPSPTSR